MEKKSPRHLDEWSSTPSWAKSIKLVIASRWFQNFILVMILFAGALVGLETIKTVVHEYGTLLKLFDQIVLLIFTVEIALKILAEGYKPWRFFKDGWNIFDFLIIGICLLPWQAPFLAVLRLVRILRVLRLVSVLPRLQLLVGALLKSLPSIGLSASTPAIARPEPARNQTGLAGGESRLP